MKWCTYLMYYVRGILLFISHHSVPTVQCIAWYRYICTSTNCYYGRADGGVTVLSARYEATFEENSNGAAYKWARNLRR